MDTQKEPEVKREKPIRINAFEVENLKRVKAVAVDCSGRSLTVIGGANAQGKTSVLDGIAYALGGERFRPSGAKREGSMVDPEIRVTLSNGLVVERRGKNSALKVTDPEGRKTGQNLLNEFIHQFALDLPKFLNASATEKANTLLQIIGVGPQLEELDKKHRALYEERHAQGRIADQKKKYAEEMASYPDAPEQLISASDLIREQQDILARNGENQRKRREVELIRSKREESARKVTRLKAELEAAEEELNTLTRDLRTAEKTSEQLTDESTAEIEKRLSEIEDINTKARANMDKAKAIEDAQHAREEWGRLDGQLAKVRDERKALLDGADLPLPGLTIIDGNLAYKGQQWDCMSGAEQLMVSTAIVRKLNPACGFVLLDRLEQMDTDTLREFGGWLESVGLQAIATRVSRGGECSIVIEDGIGVDPSEVKQAPTKQFKPGEF